MYEFALSDPDGVLVRRRVAEPADGRGARRRSVASRGVPYPNFEGKHDHPALTEPAAFVRYWVEHGVLPADHRAPHSVVLLYQRSVLDAVLASGVSPFAPRGRRNSAFLDLHVVRRHRRPVGVVGGFGIGAPAAVATMESLAAIGVRRSSGSARPAPCARASTPAMSSCATGPCATRACRTTTCRRRASPTPTRPSPPGPRRPRGGRAGADHRQRVDDRRPVPRDRRRGPPLRRRGRRGRRDGGRRAVHRRRRAGRRRGLGVRHQRLAGRRRVGAAVRPSSARRTVAAMVPPRSTRAPRSMVKGGLTSWRPLPDLLRCPRQTGQRSPRPCPDTTRQESSRSRSSLDPRRARIGSTRRVKLNEDGFEWVRRRLSRVVARAPGPDHAPRRSQTRRHRVLVA